MNWFKTLKERCLELARDSAHSMDMREYARITKGITRQLIVDLYEAAYSELAESFHGHLERISELESEQRILMDERKKLSEYAGELFARLEVERARVAGLLKVIETPPDQEIYQPLLRTMSSDLMTMNQERS